MNSLEAPTKRAVCTGVLLRGNSQVGSRAKLDAESGRRVREEESGLVTSRKAKRMALEPAVPGVQVLLPSPLACYRSGCRTVWPSVALVVFLLPGVLLGQTPDLSVTNIVALSSPSVGQAVDFRIDVISAGGTGVWVTTIFTPPVTFNSGSSSAGVCSLVPVGSDPSTTVTCPATGAPNVTINVTPQTSGTLWIVAGIIGNEFDPDMTYNSLATSVTVTAASVQPPTGLVATQTSETVITVTWTAPTGGADYYEVSRTETYGGSYSVISSNWVPTSFSDSTGTQGHTYIYRARANRGGIWSGYSNIDPASRFTDFLITQYSTTAKAAHVTELRTAIDVRRAIALLGSANWTPTISPGVTIQRGDIQQLRDRLDDAMGAGSYTDQPLTSYQPGAILIKKEHIQQLRNRVQ